jgi:hypothetical protein
LFLIDSVSSDLQFKHSVQVPDGFLGLALPVPHPVDGPFYVKLRDDPSVANPTTLIVQQSPASPDDLARSAARQPGLAKDDNSASELGENAPATNGAPQNTPTLPSPPQPTQPHRN